MSLRLLKNWSGAISIFWMVGIFIFLDNAPESFFLFKLNMASWRVEFGFLGIWLGVGLLFAATGLRCGKPVGQLFAIVAVIVFLYFACQLFPSVSPVSR
jgi:hypothetical protein